MMSKGQTVFERRQPEKSLVAKSLSQTRQAVWWLEDLEPRPSLPIVRGRERADIAVVGGGYLGLWTALLAKRRSPGARVVLLEGRTLGWAASGRNGGFCEASITHGRENGAARWPNEIETLERMGLENLDSLESDLRGWGARAEFERAGVLNVATEPHQVPWVEARASRAAARGDESILSYNAEQVRAELNSPTYLGAIWDTRGSALVHPAKLVAELARVAQEEGVEIRENSPVRLTRTSGDRSEVRLEAPEGVVYADKVALGTNAFPSLLRRNRFMTVPVYDYVLMSEPLTAEQLSSLGWRGRQGVADMANQFHYYRLTRDNRILFGGYDAIYHTGGRIRSAYENRSSSFEKLASHFFTTFPQLEGVAFTNKWAGVIDTCTRFSAFFGTARASRVAYAAGFTGLGVGATRFAAEVMLDLLNGEDTERTALEMVRTRPLPFPPEPVAALGINLTRRSLDRADRTQGKRDRLLKTLDAVGLGFNS